MPDREKVIKGLKIERECVSRDCDRDCAKCDLVQDKEWLLSVYDDALELLKEQEPIRPYKTISGSWLCGACKRYPVTERCCPGCGRKVNWSEFEDD